jgi:hypothetical protein
LSTVRAVLCGVVSVLVMASPAHAGSGSSNGVTVAVEDVVWSGYDCVTHPVSVSVDAADHIGWVLAVQAGPTGRQRLDSTAFIGVGPSVTSGGLLLCPADSAGPWTVNVSGRVGLTTQTNFAVGFNVSKAPTATTLESARRTEVGTKVRGDVSAGTWSGRAGVRVKGRKNGRWVVLGHTYPRKDGRFRFVTPKSVSRVRVDYLGDDVTQPSSAGPRRISTSSSR